MFKPDLTTYCPGCSHRVEVRATEHTDGYGLITTTRTTDHECDAISAEKRRDDDAIMRTLLLSAQ